MTPQKQPCPYDPAPLTDVPLGMFHCPLCNEMILAGMPHPDYSDFSEEEMDILRENLTDEKSD